MLYAPEDDHTNCIRLIIKVRHTVNIRGCDLLHPLCRGPTLMQHTHKHIVHHSHPSWQFGLWVRVISSRWTSCDAVTCVCLGGRLPRNDTLSRGWCCQVSTSAHTYTCVCLCMDLCMRLLIRSLSLRTWWLMPFYSCPLHMDHMSSGCCWWCKQGTVVEANGAPSSLKWIQCVIFRRWAKPYP